MWTMLVEGVLDEAKPFGILDIFHQFRSWWRSCCYLATAPPHGGNVGVDATLLWGFVHSNVLLVKSEYSDDLGAAFVSSGAFAALKASRAPLRRRLGTSLFLSAMKMVQRGYMDRDRNNTPNVRTFFLFTALCILTSHHMHHEASGASWAQLPRGNGMAQPSDGWTTGQRANCELRRAVPVSDWAACIGPTHGPE